MKPWYGDDLATACNRIIADLKSRPLTVAMPAHTLRPYPIYTDAYDIIDGIEGEVAAYSARLVMENNDES